jgi:hypothetical protein
LRAFKPVGELAGPAREPPFTIPDFNEEDSLAGDKQKAA